MSLSRRMFTKEFKEAAVRRLELGASIAEVARACEVNPNVLHRWKRELRDYGLNLPDGYTHDTTKLPGRNDSINNSRLERAGKMSVNGYRASTTSFSPVGNSLR